MDSLSFINSRHQLLYGSSLVPRDTCSVKAAVVFVHGYAEHSARKAAVFEQLAASGIAVYFYDVHGFGRSEPTAERDRALIWDYQYLVDDCCKFAQHARAYHAQQGLPMVPWFLAGFSLGGLTVAHAAVRKQQAWAGLVLVSACMWVRMTLMTRIQRMVGPILNYLCPRARIVQQLDPAQDLNPDPEQIAEYVADPLVYRERTAVSTAYQMGQALFAMKELRSQLELPLFALHATADNITPYKDLVEFFNATSTPAHQKHLHTIQGGYHDLLGGRDRQEHVQGIIDWLLSTAAAANIGDGKQGMSIKLHSE